MKRHRGQALTFNASNRILPGVGIMDIFTFLSNFFSRKISTTAWHPVAMRIDPAICVLDPI
jgi:hypothetical protein